MAKEGSFLDVTILGREYRVACEPGEREALESAVVFVDGRMREIAGSAKNPSPERVAVMAALNIAHEFLSHRASHSDSFDTVAVKRRIDAMEARLDALLAMLESPRGAASPQEELFGQ
jgi:cell division protein ZapA